VLEVGRERRRIAVQPLAGPQPHDALDLAGVEDRAALDLHPLDDGRVGRRLGAGRPSGQRRQEHGRRQGREAAG
jgi:hypothetical protein